MPPYLWAAAPEFCLIRKKNARVEMRIEAGTTMAADEELIKQLEDAGEAFDQECQELKLDKDPIPTRTTPEGRVFLGFFGTQHVGEQGAA